MLSSEDYYAECLLPCLQCSALGRPDTVLRASDATIADGIAWQTHPELPIDALLDQRIDVLCLLRERQACILQRHVPSLQYHIEFIYASY